MLARLNIFGSNICCKSVLPLLEVNFTVTDADLKVVVVVDAGKLA
jgi:hypothetical protein